MMPEQGFDTATKTGEGCLTQAMGRQPAADQNDKLTPVPA